MRNIKLPVPYYQAVPQLALRHPVHSRQQALLNRRQIEFVLRFLVAGEAVVVAGQVVPQFGEPIGEDPFV
jgi:hypothetical protein